MNFRFLNVGLAFAEMHRLTEAIQAIDPNFPNATPVFNITKANERVAELEKTLEEKKGITPRSKTMELIQAKKDDMAQSRETALQMAARIDGIFGAGTAEKLTGGAFTTYKGITQMVAKLLEAKTTIPAPAPVAAAPKYTPVVTPTPTPKPKAAPAAKAAPAPAPTTPPNLTKQLASMFHIEASKVEKFCYQNHLRYPGMASDAVLAEKFYRVDASRLVGFARTERSMRQDAINKMFSTKKS